MTELLTRDADALHRALGADGDQVDIRLSRETAEWVAELIDARVHGREVVVPLHEEVTPTAAGALLGMSRPQVRKLMDQGKLEFRMVGTHHRVQLSSIRSLIAADQAHMEVGMAALSELQNELGLLE